MRELVLENYVNNAIKARVTWEAQYFLFFFSSLSLAPRSRSDEKSSLSLVEKIKGGWNIRKLRSQLFARQILLPFFPAKMFPYRCVRAPSITQNAFKLKMKPVHI